MNVKSMLFGTAAGLMAASGALAADLPGDAAPAAVDYVKVCDAYGAGFFYIPGTETCLRIKGRVRAGVAYNNYGGDLAAAQGNNDNVALRADARVGFDARSASDLGMVRSYFEFGLDDATNNILLMQSFIQVGYVTVGRHDEVADGDGLYGINDSTWAPGDYTAVGASVLVDKLAGGFYVGAGVYSNTKSVSRPTIWSTGQEAGYQASGIVGITGQSWGSFDVSGVYRTFDKGDNDLFGVKATANLKLIDNLSLRAWAAYTDGGKGSSSSLTNIAGFKADNIIDLALAASYQVTDPMAVYAGVRYQIVDAPAGASADDFLYGNLGVDYKLAEGLNLQGEVDYGRQNDWSDFTAVTRLVRVW
ncbi:porin [Pleomorphomonas oryzae]|uniref:porin n=1 Tax=Pleomorphomonas oryzae TaxID=261934 RepID=UPI0003F6FDF7|nr:porin [Pleomorphomonas oryzae]